MLQVITSCNSTQQELCREFADQAEPQRASDTQANAKHASNKAFEYVDHIRTYPKFKFGGVEGSKVCTVAFQRSFDALSDVLQQSVRDQV